jgi:hypothetical protein
MSLPKYGKLVALFWPTSGYVDAAVRWAPVALVSTDEILTAAGQGARPTTPAQFSKNSLTD